MSSQTGGAGTGSPSVARAYPREPSGSSIFGGDDIGGGSGDDTLFTADGRTDCPG